MKGNHIKIIVLDDDPLIITAFRRLITTLPYDYEPVFFSEAEKALSAFLDNRAKFDAMIIDIHMPNLNGLDFATAVREIRPDIPLVFMTAFSPEDIHSKIKVLGNVAFFEKPFHLESILKDTIPLMIQRR